MGRHGATRPPNILVAQTADFCRLTAQTERFKATRSTEECAAERGPRLCPVTSDERRAMLFQRFVDRERQQRSLLDNGSTGETERPIIHQFHNVVSGMVSCHRWRIAGPGYKSSVTRPVFRMDQSSSSHYCRSVGNAAKDPTAAVLRNLVGSDSVRATLRTASGIL